MIPFDFPNWALLRVYENGWQDGYGFGLTAPDPASALERWSSFMEERPRGAA